MSDTSECTDVPGPSTAEGNESQADSLHSGISKVGLKTAFEYTKQLCLQNNLIGSEPCAEITEEHIQIGKEMYRKTLDVLAEKKLVVEDDLISFQELDEEGLFEEVVQSGSPSSDDYEPDNKKAKMDADYVPLDYKIKVVNLAREHPNWSLGNLQSKGASRLKNMEDLKTWREDIIHGGTEKDKFNTIDSWTHDRFIEARECNQQVSTRNLQQWALSAASQFPDLNFEASNSWVSLFKQRHRIRQRKIKKFLSENESAPMHEILAAAKRFRIQARAVIPNYDKNFVINTDPTGFQYQSTYDRSLAEGGSKVLVKRKDMNEVANSYTAQYAVTLSGKLIPTVFVCLQEPTGSFGPRVKKSVDEYARKYRNVLITSSKSGKLTTARYKDFLNDVLKPYVRDEKFLLLLNSLGGQGHTNPGLYDQMFQDKEGLPTCAIKVIPPKCTLLVQPCDAYFYRQVKNLIKRLQNSAHLIEQNREISSREDCIKIQSIVHHQLSAPIFGDMLRYAWYAAKLCDDREPFVNVNQACFAIDVLEEPCACKNSAFITCARCRNNYCFQCFYDQYHPASCSAP